MKNNIAIILIAGAIAAPILAEAQGGLLSQRRGHGAPNSLTNQQGGQGSQNGTVNRGTLRRPFNSGNQEGNHGQTGQGRGNQHGGQSTQGGQRGQRGSGMSTTPRGGNNGQSNHGQTGNQQGGQRGQGGQGNQGSTLRERLNLSEEQLSKLRAAYKEWKTYAKSIHQNQELSQEEKKAKLKAGFKKYDAKLREILTREQYAKLVQIRRNASRPNQNNNNNTGNNNTGQSGHSRAQHRSEIRELLQLTEEQLSKLRAIHQYATKKIKAIIANEELTRDEKKKKIKEVKKQAHNRRMEVLTEEQKRKLREYYARHRAQHQQQNGTHNSGQPRGRHQGNTNGENPQHQQGGQSGQRGNNSGQSHGRNHGNTNGQNPQRQQGGQHTSQSDKVILYVAPGCGYCTKAAKLLKENNVDFVKVDISSDHAARRELARKTREANIQWRGGVPVTDARGDIIVGYNRTALSRIE